MSEWRVPKQCFHAPNLRYVSDHDLIRGTPKSAGLDLRVAEQVTLNPGRYCTVDTATRVAIPDGCVGLMRGRSGLHFKYGLVVFEGTIDADYRGSLKVSIRNTGWRPYTIIQGERVAQLVIVRFEQVAPMRVESLDASERGGAGFGSTGKK